MRLDRTDIERRVPHAGAMCLLDGVLHWDREHIVCQAAAPTADHPLAREGRISSVIAPEYAAQATAVHGALLDAHSRPRAGVLAKLAQVDLLRADIPHDAGPLKIQAELLSREASGCFYAFEVSAAGQAIARGRLIVAFNAGEVT
ncbi:MAG: hydroxymyristoyl-ACP dehydratase [Caldimonas sp.]|uniref:hydroxymyristoyl-ACP dehydratase n=1 Tax=Caldimonas sp. TaxID=2838790 RepID=UPI00391C05EF